MTPDFELVVPAYNEARSLPALAARAAAAAREAGFGPDRFRLVVVDNGSTDGTAAVLEALAATPDGAYLAPVRVAVNRGYGHGVHAGLRATVAAVVGWSHADLQCDPADAFRALAALAAAGGGRTLVKGLRHGRALRDVAVSRTFEGLARVLLGLRAPEANAQPKVFPRALLDVLDDPPDGFAFDLYVLYRAARAGWQVRTVDVAFPPRVHGASRWAATLLSRHRTIAGMVRYMAALAWREGRV